MSGFKEMAAADLDVFLNSDEFAFERTIVYNGIKYKNVKANLTRHRQGKRNSTADDNKQGLYSVTAVMHCKAADLDGKQPETEQRIRVTDDEGYFLDFKVAGSSCEFGMLRVELEAIDE